MADIGLSFLQPIALQQKMDEEAAQAPATLAHTLATTRYNTAMADRLETETAGEKQAAALMAQQLGQQAETQGSGSFSDMLLNQAKIFSASGLPVKAQAAMQAAATAKMHEVRQQGEQQRITVSQGQLALKRAKLISDTFSGVQSPEDWDAANRTIATQTGADSPFANLPYDPKTVEFLQQQALGAKEQAELVIKRQNLQSKIADRMSAIHHRSVMEGVAEDRLDLSRQREGRLAKTGGKDVGAPQKRDVDAATTLLGSEPGLVSDADAPLAAYDIASEALARRKANPGIAMNEAMRQVMQEKKVNGDFTPAQPNVVMGLKLPFGGKGAKYDAALSMPTSRDKLEVGKKYKDPKSGQVGVWNGKGWSKPAAAPAAPSSRSSSGAVADEEDDDAEEQ